MSAANKSPRRKALSYTQDDNIVSRLSHREKYVIKPQPRRRLPSEPLYYELEQETHNYKNIKEKHSLHPRRSSTPKRQGSSYVLEDIYSCDTVPLSSEDEQTQGYLSLYKPIRSEYLTLSQETSLSFSNKYSSLPKEWKSSSLSSKYRNNYTPSRNGYVARGSKFEDIRMELQAKDNYDFRIGKARIHRSINQDERFITSRNRSCGNYDELPRWKLHYKHSDMVLDNGIRKLTVGACKAVEPPKLVEASTHTENGFKPGNVCQTRAKNKTEIEQISGYWTKDKTTAPVKRIKAAKEKPMHRKIVTFSEVSGCEERRTIINDPICGRKVVPVRELEVSLDQMIQNGYFERNNIRIQTNDMAQTKKGRKLPNGHVNSGKLDHIMTNGNCLIKENIPEKPLGQFVQPKSRRPRHLSQVIAALAVSMAPFSAGLGKGYSSPAIASLQSAPDSTNNSSSTREFSVTDQEASWVASLSLLGALFGGAAGGVAMRLGRRRVLLVAAPPFSLCWLLTMAAGSVEAMCLSSFIAGFCCSIVTMVSQVYISEISVPDIRGCLSAVLKIVGHLGVLMSFTVGAYLDWQKLAMFISVAPLILFCTVIYIPETPSYLVLCGKEEEAYKSLIWLRGAESDVVQELATIRSNVLASKNYKNRRTQYNQGNLVDTIMVNRLIGPILITCGLMTFQRFSGVHAFNFYAVPIFRKTFGGINPHGGAIAVSFVQLLASCLSGILIDTVGRLPLLIASSVFMSMALAGFGSYTYYEEVHRHQRIQSVVFHHSVGNNDWIPLLCVLVFTIAFSLGMSPISWLLIGELFPLEYRGVGSAIATAFSYLCAFISVKTFIDFQQILGLHGAFWLYASISVGGLCFVVCCVPETKGKDLDEMEPKYLQNVSIQR